jgi:hypothetical protein
MAEVDALLPRLADARHRYAATMSDDNWSHLVAIQNEGSLLCARFGGMVEALGTTDGFPSEFLSKIGELASEPDRNDLPRRNLIREKIGTTGNLDDHIAEALAAIERLLPRGWIEAEPREQCRLDSLARPESVLSLTKSLRWESEALAVHRFRQALMVSRDYLAEHPAYDHFAGATLVPSIVQLGSQLENLKQVRGNVDARLQRLWCDHGDDVDATLMEIVTAGRCAELGRNVEFIEPTSSKSPDLRCHDPLPVVIECKRQQALSDYEITEQAIMRDLFLRLRAEAGRRGLCGRFSLRLDVEASALDVEEVVACLVRQRLAAHPERELTYGWGRTAFAELPQRLVFKGPTRLYSPRMLEDAFGWRSDLPEWDGLCCSIDNARGLWMSDVQRPLALIWNNTSASALKKRTWAPTNLFGTAAGQIPPGDMGIVYIAYLEGAREDVADLRVHAFLDRIEAWEHAGNIRIPVSFLSRLYPRPLEHGQPDLIESTIRLCSASCGHPVLFEYFPTTIFTRPS